MRGTSGISVLSVQTSPWCSNRSVAEPRELAYDRFSLSSDHESIQRTQVLLHPDKIWITGHGQDSNTAKYTL